MSFLSAIINILNDVSDWFYEIYLECFYGAWPISALAHLFLKMCYLFNDLAWGFSDFGSWVRDISSKIAQVLNWNTIWSSILSYVPNLIQIRDWFYSWVNNVLGLVDNWWSSVRWTVQGWIDTAVSGFRDLINQLEGSFTVVLEAWDSFKGKIPTLEEVAAWFGNWTGEVFSAIDDWWSGTIGDVQALISSALIEYEPFWAGWQDWRDQVVEFFTDPLQWLYNKLDEWFERFW